MTDRNNDDVARALEALSAGEHHEDPEHDSTAHLHQPAPAPVRSSPRPASKAAPGAAKPSQPPAPARPASGTARPAAPNPPRPAAPEPSRPAAQAPKPVARPAAPAATRPATPRPAAPSAAPPAAPVTRPATPAAARPAAPAATASASAPAPDSQIVDDDAVIVPAPDASVFFHKPAYASKPKRPAFGHSVGFRQTLIPILLTAGFIMVMLGLLHFLWGGDNNPLADLPGWLLAVLFLFGFMLWGFAAANMLSVKAALDRQRKAAN